MPPDEPYDFSKAPSQRLPVFKPQRRRDVTSPYGAPRPYGPHTGEDFGWKRGEGVGTPMAGRVRFAGPRSGYGNRVEVEHPDGTVTTYSHFDRVAVKQGDEVDEGSLLGYVGQTGTATGPNVHFEVVKGGKKINPEGSGLSPVRGASEVKYRTAGYDFSNAPSQQGIEKPYDFSQAPSQAVDTTPQQETAPIELKPTINSFDAYTQTGQLTPPLETEEERRTAFAQPSNGLNIGEHISRLSPEQSPERWSEQPTTPDEQTDAQVQGIEADALSTAKQDAEARTKALQKKATQAWESKLSQARRELAEARRELARAQRGGIKPPKLLSDQYADESSPMYQAQETEKRLAFEEGYRRRYEAALKRYEDAKKGLVETPQPEFQPFTTESTDGSYSPNAGERFKEQGSLGDMIRRPVERAERREELATKFDARPPEDPLSAYGEEPLAKIDDAIFQIAQGGESAGQTLSRTETKPEDLRAARLKYELEHNEEARRLAFTPEERQAIEERERHLLEQYPTFRAAKQAGYSVWGDIEHTLGNSLSVVSRLLPQAFGAESVRDASDYLRKRAAANLTIGAFDTSQGLQGWGLQHEILKRGMISAGSIVKLVALQRATGASLPTIMFTESTIDTLDEPDRQKAARTIIKSVAYAAVIQRLLGGEYSARPGLAGAAERALKGGVKFGGLSAASTLYETGKPEEAAKQGGTDFLIGAFLSGLSGNAEPEARVYLRGPSGRYIRVVPTPEGDGLMFREASANEAKPYEEGGKKAQFGRILETGDLTLDVLSGKADAPSEDVVKEAPRLIAAPSAGFQPAVDEKTARPTADVPISETPPVTLQQGVTTPPVPETPETLASQVEALRAGRRAVVEVTPDALNDVDTKVVVPQGMRSFKTFDGGRIIYNPDLVDRGEVVRRMDDGTLAELMGIVEVGSKGEAGIVTAKDSEGREVQSARVSTPEGQQAQVEAFREQHPEATIETGGEDLAGRVIAERQAESGVAPKRSDVTQRFAGNAPVGEGATPESAPVQVAPKRTLTDDDLRGIKSSSGIVGEDETAQAILDSPRKQEILAVIGDATPPKQAPHFGARDPALVFTRPDGTRVYVDLDLKVNVGEDRQWFGRPSAIKNEMGIVVRVEPPTESGKGATPEPESGAGKEESKSAAGGSEVSSPEPAPVQTEVHHSQRQPRDTDGTFKEGELLESGDSYRRKADGQVLAVRDVREGNVELGERGNDNAPTVNVPRAEFDKTFEKTAHKFSSTQVDLPSRTAREVKAVGKQLIPDSVLYTDPKDPSFGREENPHVTVKYGLHTEDASEVRRALEGEPPVTVKFGDVSLFSAKGDTPYDVVKVDIDSPDLHRLNAKIADALKVTDTHPEYKPHVTLAYVKAGEGKAFEGDKSLTGKTLTIDKVTFSSSNGKTTEIPLSEAEGNVARETKQTTTEINTVRPEGRQVEVGQESGHPEGETRKASGQGEEEKQAVPRRRGIYVRPRGERAKVEEADERVERYAKVIDEANVADRIKTLEKEGGYLSQFTPEQRAEAMKRNRQSDLSGTRRWAERLLKNIDERNTNALLETLHTGNMSSRKVFEQETGIRLGRTDKEARQGIKQWVGADKFDADVKAREDEQKVDRAKREEVSARASEGRALEQQVRREDGRVVTKKQFIDEIIGEGYTETEAVKKGIADVLRLGKPDLERGGMGVFYEFKSKAEQSYIKRTLAELTPKENEKSQTEAGKAEPLHEYDKFEHNKRTYQIEHIDYQGDSIHASDLSGKYPVSRAWSSIGRFEQETGRTVASNPTPKPSVSDIFDEEFNQMFGEELKASNLKDVAEGLSTLFGSPLKAARAEEFDEDKYLQAKPLFTAGIEHSGGDLSDIRASVKGLLSALRSRFDMKPEVIQRMKPYIVRFIEESETGKEATDLLAGTRKLIDTIKERLRGEGIKDNPQLTRMADEAFGGTRAQGVYGPKDVYDALEVAVNELLGEDAKRLMGIDPKEALKELRALLKKLPTQTDRTTEQQELQQFSTPPTEAFVAARALAPTADDVVLEPSAGTGSLALWPKAVGAEVYANEIAPRRRALLEAQGFETTSVDAQFLDDLLPDDIRPTAILMNPPFSSTGGRVAKNRTIYGAEHVTDALKRLEDGGRLVAIVGEGMGLDRPAFREWWSKVFEEYNVRANISVPGEEYGKYGTTFGNQLVIIDKTGQTPGETLAEQIGNVISASPESLEGVLDAIEPIIRRPLATPRRDIRRSGGRSKDETPTRGGRESVGARAEPRRAADEDTRGRAGEGRAAVSKGESANQPQPSGENAAPDSGGSDDNDVRQQLKLEHNTEAREEDSANFVTYRPAKLKGGVKHPGLIVESASMAAVDPPDITYRPKLNSKIISEGKLSDLQYEAVSYAGQRHEQRLPNGNRAAMFIGDGTGVGKGRILAGITLDNWNQGRRRIVWMSVNTDLVPSTERDLKDLGATNIPLAVVNDFSAQAKQLDFKDGVLFVAYPTLVKTAQNGQTRLDQIREWLGDDGIILLDEAHLAKNAVTEGMKESSQRGEKIVALQEGENTNPNWRFVYASATGATEVANMGYMARLGLWGDGTSFPGGFAEFKSAIDGGGVGAMEMVSRDMKAMGMYTARTLSFKGVTYREAVHSLTPTQRELYDTAAKAWQVVLQNVNRALDITNADSRAKMHARRRFWNDQQRFFRQFITALKVPTAIKEIDKALADGSSVVLGLYGTGEARTKEQVKKALAVGADLEDLDFSPKEILRNLVAKAFPTQRYTEQSDPSNPRKVIKVPVVDSDGRPVESAQAKAMRDRLLEELDKLALPENPLDQIVNHFGPDKVAEITGRSKRLVRNPETGKNEYVKRVSGVSMEKASQHEMDAFQEGRKRIAIISASASTGISLHADNTRANKERRAHITLETGWSADVQMQTFGRTHRSNEASQPEYVLLATDVGGEKRFLSTIAKRLASLGALTKGERKATGMGSGDEGLEKYDFMNDYGRAAIHSITDQVKMNRGPEGLNSAQTWERMGLVKKTDKGTEFEEPDVERFLNRILALSLDEQNKMFDWFTETFNRVVSQAKESGTFDEGVTDIKGDAVRMTDEPQVVATDKTTGAETVHYQMEVDERTKPVSFESLEGKKGDFYKQNRSGNIIFAEESGSRTDASGRVFRRFYVTLPRASRDHLLEQSDLAAKYTQIKPEEAKSLWNAEYADVPKMRTKEVHLIGGAIIPVWQRLQQRDSQGNTVQLKVVRMETDEGRRVVGVRVPTKSVGSVLKAIGVQRSFKEPSAIFNSVYEQGETVKLVSGLSLERVRFKGDEAVELKGADRYKINELKGMGLRHEIVNYDDRLFVPTNEKTGVEVLTKLLERYPAMSEEPLKMARADKSLEVLRGKHFDELVPKATLKRDGYLLEVNAEGHEILRRAFEQQQIEIGVIEPEGEAKEPSFDGLFVNAEQVKNTAKTLRAAAKELLDNGYPKEDAATLNDFAAKLTRAGLVGGKSSGRNNAIVYLFDDAIPHEEFHRAGFIGAISEALSSRHANFTELASHPVIQKAWDGYFKTVLGLSRLDEAILVEETAAWIAGGKAGTLGLTEDESADYLRLWLTSYAKQNGDAALDNFIEAGLPHVREIISQLREGQAEQRSDTGGVEGRERGPTEEPAPRAESPDAGRETRPEEDKKLKPRSLPATLRAKGIDAADQLYELYPNKASLADGKRLFETLGFEASEALLKSGQQLGAEHMALSDILQRALLQHASDVSESDPDLAAEMRARQQSIAKSVSATSTKAGQFTQAASANQYSVEDVTSHAADIAKERGRDLTPKEAARTHQLGEALETSTATLEVAAIQARDAREAVKGDDEEIERAEAGELSPDEVKRLRKRLQELRERERERTAEGAKLVERLAKQRETLASLREKESRRKRNIEEMEGRLPPRKPTERKQVSVRKLAADNLSKDESDLVAQVMAVLGQRPLMMARVEDEAKSEDAPKPLDDVTLGKLARIGAIRLLRAERGKYSVEDFRRDMLADFGPQVEPHLDAIHAEAVNVSRAELRQANLERKLESVKSREGNEDLSRAELMEIAEREKEERKRASLVQAEHERAASKFRESERKASRIRQRTVGGRDVGSKALAQGIARHATSDLEAIAAAKLAKGITPEQFASEMKAEHELDKKGLHEAFKKGASVLESARRDINASRQMAAALKKASEATTQTERDRALVELQTARSEHKQAQESVARELRRLRKGRVRTLVGEAISEVTNLSIPLMASGDVSALGNQGGVGVWMHPSLAPEFAEATLKSWTKAGFANTIDKIEQHPDFHIWSGAMKVNFSFAGNPQEAGEEMFRRVRLLHRIPVAKQTAGKLVEKSDESFGGGLDRLRASFADLIVQQLRAQGYSVEKNPHIYERMGAYVNIITGKGDIGPHNTNVTKALYAVARVFSFAPRLRISRLQFLTLPLNPSFYENVPPQARRIIWKDLGRYYSRIGALNLLLRIAKLLGLATVAGLAFSTSFDPDDDDYLKTKIGKLRLDLTGGQQSNARFVSRVLLSAGRGLVGQITPDMAGKDILNSLLQWEYSGGHPVATLAIDRLRGKDFTGKPFTWFGDYGFDGALGTRLTPMSWNQALDTGLKEGVGYGVPQGILDAAGVRANTYPDRPDEPTTTGEKLTRRYAERDFGRRKPLDEQTKRKLDELKTRSRAGEDVSDEVKPFVDSDVISKGYGDSIVNAKNQTSLQGDFRKLSLEDALHVYEYYTPDEKRSVDAILKRKELESGTLLSPEVQKEFRGLDKQFYHAPAKIKISGKERKLSDEDRTNIESSITQSLESFFHPTDEDGKAYLKQYEDGDKEERKKILDRVQRQAAGQAVNEFKSQWVDAHADELDAEEGWKFTETEKSEMRRQSQEASDKAVGNFLSPSSNYRKRRLEEYEKATPTEQRQILDDVRREAIDRARDKFKREHKDKQVTPSVSRAYPVYRPQAAV